MADTVPVDGLYVKSPSASKPLLAPPPPAPSIKVIWFSSFVFSLSVIRTWAAFVEFVTVVPVITSAKLVPLTVIASASKVPSTSTSPDISKLVASISPEAFIITPLLALTLNVTWLSVVKSIKLSASLPIFKSVANVLPLTLPPPALAST